jgi:hypothetical protein
MAMDKVVETVVGKEIAEIFVSDCNSLVIEFVDGTKLISKDMAQSCCEHRYMSCDDDLAYLRGSVLRDVSVRDGNRERSNGGDEHEVEFLVVETSQGSATVANHNEHNGYYGGFSVVFSVV